MSDEPTKEQLPGELRRALNALSDEVQHEASLRLAPSSLEPHASGMSLDEVMVTLGQARDVLSDALETGKFVQAPLAVQSGLFGQVRDLGRVLAGLAEGQSDLPDLHGRAERLNADVWPFRLLDVSADGVMSFHARMNQLKTQEALIRRTARAAGEFDTVLKNADGMLAEVAERASSIAEERMSTAALVEQMQARLRKSTEISEQLATLTTQAERQESIATRQLVAARQAFSDTEAVAANAKEAEAEVAAGRDRFQALSAQVEQLLSTADSAAKAQRDAAAQKHGELVKGLSADFAKAAAEHHVALEKRFEELTHKGDAAVDAFITRSEKSLDEGDDEVKALVEHLEELEGQIDEAMERATGLSLLHAFQRRQSDIIRARVLWARAFSVSVVLLLGVAGYAIFALSSVPAGSTAFYWRLSIAIAVIAATGYSGLRFSRERTREKEFAASVPPGLHGVPSE